MGEPGAGAGGCTRTPATATAARRAGPIAAGRSADVRPRARRRARRGRRHRRRGCPVRAPGARGPRRPRRRSTTRPDRRRASPRRRTGPARAARTAASHPEGGTPRSRQRRRREGSRAGRFGFQLPASRTTRTPAARAARAAASASAGWCPSSSTAPAAATRSSRPRRLGHHPLGVDRHDRALTWSCRGRSLTRRPARPDAAASRRAPRRRGTRGPRGTSRARGMEAECGHQHDGPCGAGQGGGRHRRTRRRTTCRHVQAQGDDLLVQPRHALDPLHDVERREAHAEHPGHRNLPGALPRRSTAVRA